MQYEQVARWFRTHEGLGGATVVARPATAEQIGAAERQLGAQLPDSFRRFQLEFGDYQNGAIDILSVVPALPPASDLVSVNVEARTVMGPRLPRHLIAFSNNGAGDLYCFDTETFDGNEAGVVIWDHELGEDQTPERAARSFVHWLHDELQEQVADARYARRLGRRRWRLTVLGAFARDILRNWRRSRDDE